MGMRGRPNGPDMGLIKRNNEIVAKLKKGNVTLTDLGKEYGLTKERVRQIANTAGLTGRKLKTWAIAGARRQTEKVVLEKERRRQVVSNRIEAHHAILRMGKAGVKQAEIAETLDVSQSLVSLVLIKAGVRRRTPEVIRRK
jgi:hypothetical protein